MKRQLRLRNQGDFARLRAEGIILKHPMFQLSFAPNCLTHNRYGFIVQRRLGKAAKRNLIKRQLREAIRILHAKLRQGYDIIVIARLQLTKHSFVEIQNTLQNQFKLADLWFEEESK